MAEYQVIEGEPLDTVHIMKLRDFLEAQELEYDEQITYTYMLEDQNKIIASGSCSGNIIKCIAVDPDYQGQNLLAEIITRLVNHLVSHGITHYFGFTKPKNKKIFLNMGLYPVAETENVLLLENRKNGLAKYVQKLVEETKKAQEAIDGQLSELDYASDKGIGAIVANCNPFTKGHRYLIVHAAKECKWLHVFILSDQNQMFSQKQRLEMARIATSDLSNVIIHGASDYLISPAVFPTYFIKDKVHAYEINCSLDIRIFGSYIAKELGITKRFVGTEPQCEVTAQYNCWLKWELPDYGIEYHEIERIAEQGSVVSASVVRRALERKDWETVFEMIPLPVCQYLEECQL